MDGRRRRRYCIAESACIRGSRRRRCAAPLARLPRRALPWGGPPGAAGPHSCRHADQRRLTRRAGRCHAGRLPRRTIIQLAATASRALPAVASHAIGFADPRPGVHSPGLAPIEEDGGRAGYGGGADSRHAELPGSGQRSIRSAARQVKPMGAQAHRYATTWGSIFDACLAGDGSSTGCVRRETRPDGDGRFTDSASCPGRR